MRATVVSDLRAADAEVVEVKSNGVGYEFVVAVPMGIFMVIAGVYGLVTHVSAGVIVVAMFSVAFGASILVSCAFSLWGACSIVFVNGHCIVTHSIWRHRWRWQFATSRIRAAFLYDPPPGYMMFPGMCGAHIRVSVDRSPRSIPVASGLRASRETLDRIQAMFLKAAENAGVVAPGGTRLL